MLDLEVVVEPKHTGLNIVTLDEMKKHLRITSTKLDAQIAAAVVDAADVLHGRDGDLNRTLFPMQWVRYLPAFPVSKRIPLPFPPLQSVVSVAYENGSSPSGAIQSSSYIVRKGYIGEIELLATAEWPDAIAHPRAVAITYAAGYTDYPPILKRMVKLLAEHLLENTSATVNDPKLANMNTEIRLGYQWCRDKLRVSPSYDDWSCDA